MPDWRLPKLAVALVGLALLQGVEADPSFAVVGDVAIIRVKDTRNNVYREVGLRPAAWPGRLHPHGETCC